jgi:hypothetical protein
MNLHKNFATLSHYNKQEKKFEITVLNKKKQNCSKGTTKFQPLKLPKSANKIPAFGFA